MNIYSTHEHLFLSLSKVCVRQINVYNNKASCGRNISDFLTSNLLLKISLTAGQSSGWLGVCPGKREEE